MSTTIEIADAVVTELNAGVFSMALTSVRKVLPSFTLIELADLKVTVVPKSIDMTMVSRVISQSDIEIDIGIQKKIGSDVDTDVSALIVLVEEIIDYMRKRVLSDATDANWIGTQNDPIYAQEHLSSDRLFTSIITLTYRKLVNP